ncbi:unnamed protein product [Choristocarpus tenellus]
MTRLWSILAIGFAGWLVVPGTALHQLVHCRWSTALQATGFDKSSTRKGDSLKRKKNSSTIPSKSSSIPPSPDGGALPEDDFARFPPLSPDVQSTLVGVEKYGLPSGGRPIAEAPFPSEVLQQIREKHGFLDFDASADTFPGMRLLHADPVVLEIENFFTNEECDNYIAMSVDPDAPRTRKARGNVKEKIDDNLRPTVVGSATINSQTQFQQQRTSTTWFHHYAAVPELLAKASTLLGVKYLRHWEEPQTVRYRPGEKFSWHLDALPPMETGASKGGQRTATILVYLTDLGEKSGGATAFRDLGPLRVRPRKGTALLFFPSYGGEPGCPFDVRTLHAGEVVALGHNTKTKWIAQMWLHKKPYPASVPKGNSYEPAEERISNYIKTWQAGKSKE